MLHLGLLHKHNKIHKLTMELRVEKNDSFSWPNTTEIICNTSVTNSYFMINT